MTNPPCICLDVFVDAACGDMDPYAWNVEYEAYVKTGHVASCHHRSNAPKAHRGLARILSDLYADVSSISNSSRPIPDSAP